MALSERFLEFIHRQKLVTTRQQVLLAVSGGMDSMVMTQLFKDTGIRFVMAHCNFMLRPGDAELDQQLVQQTAAKLEVAFFTRTFNTLQYSHEKKLSAQMAARELRYAWLDEIRTANGFDLVATAHHLDDSIETLIINLARGTGLRGLKGIPVKNGPVIRPLLFATRDEIAGYARSQNISYREDLSNLEEKYQRNRIRHQLIPVLKELNPDLHNTIERFFQNMSATGIVLDNALEQARKHCVEELEGEYHISTKALEKLPQPDYFLFEWLQPLGFSAAVCREITENIHGQAGAQFYSPTHGVLRDREKLIVFPLSKRPAQTEISLDAVPRKIHFGGKTFTFDQSTKPEQLNWPSDNNSVFLDADKLKFPLLLRFCKPGDHFIPLGMTGKKKLSDFFTDIKMPRNQKQQVMVLISAGQIAWVAGHRPDERFKITKNTKTVFSVKMD
jgi:tRNA(Ile)-lysidine synthase